MTARPLGKVRDVLSAVEVQELTMASNASGARALLTTWSLIAFAFALVAWQPHPVTVAVALVLLGGRQLALAVLMHDASHRALFRNRRLNDFAGVWLCGAPVWSDLYRYRRHHMAHHALAGSDADPDIGLVTAFPTSRASLLRKFARDLFGVTGVKRLLGLVLIDAGLLSYNVSGAAQRVEGPHPAAAIVRRSLTNMFPVVATNVLMATVLVALGHGGLYLLWVVAYVTTFSVFLRVRSIAEHACTEQHDSPFRHTRTTRASWLARLTVAPHYVNYHLEHHLLMTAPHHNLPKLHRLLRQRGVFADAHYEPSYADVLRTATSR